MSSSHYILTKLCKSNCWIIILNCAFNYLKFNMKRKMTPVRYASNHYSRASTKLWVEIPKLLELWKHYEPQLLITSVSLQSQKMINDCHLPSIVTIKNWNPKTYKFQEVWRKWKNKVKLGCVIMSNIHGIKYQQKNQ